ncbi:MAG: polysaccharide deacetylase family protein [Acidimicrobiales bacterium]|nr:polysaccharide deacetylase family protein [Acidimicrobiales bacterium]
MADLVRPSAGITFLIYHRVGARTPVPVDLPTALFDEQMAMLADSFRVLTIDEATRELLDTTGADAGPGVVVTFDDGTADFLDEAVPVLVDRGVPATMYLATRHIEEQIEFPGGGVPMTWAAARTALGSGLVTFGSHSHSHVLFDRITPSAASEELDRSIGLIGDRLGVAPEHFAYPKALLASPRVEAQVRSRFETAVIARTRPNRPGRVDPFRLTRSPIQVADGIRWFERKASGGMGLEDDLRGLANRWRYRGARS